MPQIMTEEEAGETICPFMSFRNLEEKNCRASKCACWGWVDDEEGEPIMESMSVLSGGEDPDHREGWKYSFKTHGGEKKFHRFTGRHGDRRGQCEAMSPIIECPHEA